MPAGVTVRLPRLPLFDGEMPENRGRSLLSASAIALICERLVQCVERGRVWREAWVMPNTNRIALQWSCATACIAIHKSAEPNTLAVCLDFDAREELIAVAPETYYLKPHYENYPVVLVRLSRIQPDALRDLLSGAWRFVTAKMRSQSRKRPRPK